MILAVRFALLSPGLRRLMIGLATSLIVLPLVAAGLLALLLVLALGGHGAGGPTPVSSPAGPSAAALSDIPPEQLAAMQAAAAGSGCGLDWAVLAAVAQQESNFGRNAAMRTPHDGGILGYGQFDPATWQAYGQGGNIYAYQDALPAMARYLCALGAGSDLERALWRYSGCLPGTITGGRLCVRTDTYVRTCMRSPCGPKRMRSSTGSAPARSIPWGTRVSNSAASPACSTRSCSPSTSRTWPLRTYSHS